MPRKLFCEISPLTYKLSVAKCKMVRYIKNLFAHKKFAKKKTDELLPVVICSHSSPIMRKLSGVDMTLQKNKAQNLSIAVPKISGIVIQPGEVFSFWHLVGNTSKRKGYKQGLNITNSKVTSAVGGGMCQFSNLIHYLVLNSPLEIVEHHHHDEFDLFPDSQRRVPFGTGTSITHNYLDYRFRNTTDNPVQLICHMTDTHLCGEIRSTKWIDEEYEIFSENEKFVKEPDGIYRTGLVVRKTVNKKTKEEKKEILRKNHAKVLYDFDEKKLD